MRRLTVRFTIAAATFGLVVMPALAGLMLAPASAWAGGGEVLGEPRDRAECAARAAAREAARDEVVRQLGGGEAAGTSGRTAVSDGDPSRSADWQAAMQEADGVDLGELLEPRPLAAVGGLAWFLFVVRSRRRARARARRA